MASTHEGAVIWITENNQVAGSDRHPRLCGIETQSLAGIETPPGTRALGLAHRDRHPWTWWDRNPHRDRHRRTRWDRTLITPIGIDTPGLGGIETPYRDRHPGTWWDRKPGSKPRILMGVSPSVKRGAYWELKGSTRDLLGIEPL